ncbi:MarR family transcriptional regulator [Protaetiibacter sp. SSC-01]|uniref:MarR family winged helix-turn-helix transcriptional regulator n=1 Tax=Protaetiibacter sp. SSC-01 TaxID=2759943 RepID=UPI001657488B|nr:MarR family transcriptional regulator [Protaetiibacter sp. SSC-01]QNO37941.1 MarR family transcriptional regulator [Protaetiibacter sp. SSC-01]
MARKLDSAEPAGETPRIPEYRHDVTRSLVRVTATWMSTDYQSRFAEAAGVPDEPHAMTTMYLLIQSGPLRPTALSGILGISAAATSRLVETLASAGLVTRTPDPDDARATRIALTEQGVASATVLHEEGDRLSQRLLDGWTDEERTIFTRLMHRYADAVEDDARTTREETP